jgi:hypothetical protein
MVNVESEFVDAADQRVRSRPPVDILVDLTEQFSHTILYDAQATMLSTIGASYVLSLSIRWPN